MTSLVEALQPPGLWAFLAIAGAGWMMVATVWHITSLKNRLADAKEYGFEAERKMSAALRLAEIKQETMTREIHRLAALVKVLGGDPPADESDVVGEEGVNEDASADDASDDSLFADVLAGERARTRHYVVKLKSDSPIALRVKLKCRDASRDLASDRINLVIDELNSGIRLIATNCHELCHPDRWVFEAWLPKSAILERLEIPRAHRYDKADWMMYFERDELPHTDRQRAFDELANWFLHLLDGKEQPEYGRLAGTVESWPNYMDPLPSYTGQRVYRRGTLEEPKPEDEGEENDDS